MRRKRLPGTRNDVALEPYRQGAQGYRASVVAACAPAVFLGLSVVVRAMAVGRASIPGNERNLRH